MDAAPYRLSLDLKPPSPGWRGRAQQKKGGTLYEAQHNVAWAFDSGDTTNRRQWRLTTQLAVANRLRRGQMSRAQQQFALLRRCLYPKRDVIKWAGTWMGPSCEVFILVQQPLTSLLLGANSTCVELPYTTMWSGLALKDSNLMSSLSLGEHVHTLYARPSVEDHYFVGFEIGLI